MGKSYRDSQRKISDHRKPQKIKRLLKKKKFNQNGSFLEDSNNPSDNYMFENYREDNHKTLDF
jgi:hypothetical protein